MNIADRIQHLRKARGISQEELADQAGVSRQAVSKWESGQSIPDIDKIILLSDYFGTTTDYLLRGIEPEKGQEGRCNAVIFSIMGTLINAAGLVTAISIWMERQMFYATGVGIVIMLLGTGVFMAGQVVDGTKKAQAKYGFMMFNVWILPFIPMACCFNIVNGLLGGYVGLPAPLPMLGNSIWTFALYWVFYIAVCAAADFTVKKKKKKKR